MKNLKNMTEDDFNEALDIEDDEDQECSWCHGCGEGDYDGAACRKCHGTGIEPSDAEDDCYDDYE